jgi:hypothetical protein
MNILIVFEKLTRACFSQMALETMLLPIQIPVRTNGIGRIVLQFLIIASRFHPKCQDESGAREYETGGKGWGN